MSTPTIIQALAEHTVGQIPRGLPEVVVIEPTQTLYQAFTTLVENNILSAPVKDVSGKGYTGFLDIHDLVAFVVFVHDEQKVKDDSRLEDLIVHGIGAIKAPTTDGVTVSYLSRRNKFVPVKQDASLLEVARLLSQQSLRRVPVVDDNGEVVNIISQSSMVKFLSDHVEKLQDANKSVGELELGTSPVLSVKKSESVIETFRLMDRTKRSGVALVDETGRLVGTTTGKDLKLFLKEPTLKALHSDIHSLLVKIRSEQITIKSPTIAVFPKDNLARAIQLLAATRVHRVFVADLEEAFKPIRVISITDILKHLISLEGK